NKSPDSQKKRQRMVKPPDLALLYPSHAGFQRPPSKRTASFCIQSPPFGKQNDRIRIAGCSGQKATSSKAISAVLMLQ
ncbi:MAG: hypothetical protein N2318_10190, partial [Meiothermus sp.]|nr:hypothetical protein [Meiothermus sp.]